MEEHNFWRLKLSFENLVFCFFFFFKDKRTGYKQQVVRLKIVLKMLKSWLNTLLSPLLYSALSNSSKEHCPETAK